MMTIPHTVKKLTLFPFLLLSLFLIGSTPSTHPILENTPESSYEEPQLMADTLSDVLAELDNSPQIPNLIPDLPSSPLVNHVPQSPREAHYGESPLSQFSADQLSQWATSADFPVEPQISLPESADFLPDTGRIESPELSPNPIPAAIPLLVSSETLSLPNKTYLPIMAVNATISSTGSTTTTIPTEIITSSEGGLFHDEQRNVTLRFEVGAVTADSRAALADITPDRLPGSLQHTGISFALTVQEIDTAAEVTTFPATAVTLGSFYDEEFGRTLTETSMEETASIEIAYEDADVVGLQENLLRLYRQNDTNGTWSVVPSWTDSDSNIVYGTLGQSGDYALLAPAATAVALDTRTPLTGTNPISQTYLVILDPAHGGNDPGGRTTDPTNFAATEKTYNLQVAQLVQSQLQACGVNVVMTRDSDISVSQQARASQINSTQPDAAITLAFNIVYAGMSYTSDYLTGTGTGAFVNSGKPLQAPFGLQVTAQVNNYVGLRNRGLYTNNSWYVPRTVANDQLYTHVELAFMDNYDDRAIMDDSVGMQGIADGVMASIVDMLGGTSICTGGGSTGFVFPDPLSAAERERLRNIGYQNWQKYGTHAYRGDPVDTANGNFIQQTVDFFVSGQGSLNLAMQRLYNSLDERQGVFGYGVSSFLDMSLRFANDGTVDVRYADGSGVHFIDDGVGFTAGHVGVHDQLLRNGPDYLLQTDDQMSYHFTIFGLEALLVGIEDRNGNMIEIVRDGLGLPTEIIDASGRSYMIDYDGQLISQISDVDGRNWQYAYTNGDLTTFTDPENGEFRYTYTDHLMETLTDAENILYLENIYDGERRVIEQFDADRVQSFFSYDSGTDFTDNTGMKTDDQYDTLFRITSSTDELNQTEYFVYDNSYNLEKYTDKRGNVWDYIYDVQGNLLTETDPDGYITTYTYNAENDLTSVTDFGGPNQTQRTTTYIYDPAGNLTRINYPNNTHVIATYDNFGNMKTLRDTRGHTTAYDYDAAGNLIKITNAEGDVTQYSYDRLGRQTAILDDNQNRATFEYDDNDNIVAIVDPKLQTTRFEYDGNDNLVKIIDRRGGVTLFEYDDNLKLIAETNPELEKTTYRYDAMYNRTSMTDPLGNTTLYRYDELYRLEEVEDAVGSITRFTYDENGNLLTVTDELSYVTTFSYDDLNRVESQTNGENETTTMTYDAVGRLVSSTNPRGALTSYVYDVRGRLTHVTDADNKVWETIYDNEGNVLAQIDANGNPTQFTYDDVNRLKTVTDALGNVTRFTYDGVGNLLRVENGRTFTTHYSYDKNDNVQTITDAHNNVTTLGYNQEDLLTEATDANGNTTTWEHDLVGRVITLIEASNQTTRFIYDDAGNQKELINAKGNRWVYDYDNLNRRIKAVDPLGYTTLYGYDELNRLTSMTDAKDVVTGYRYDGVDRLVGVIQNEVAGETADSETNVTTSYSYDRAGNLHTISDGNGEVTTFEYDLLNRLTKETNPIGKIWQYTYDAVGNRLTRLDANGNLTEYQYDPVNLLRQIDYPDETFVSYTYDAVYNQETATASWLGTITNVYDELDRLRSSTDHTGAAVAYSYDPVGNRTSMTYPDGDTLTYTYDETNYQETMTDPDGNVFVVTRDATHNITEIAYPNQTTAAYTFDDAERLTAVANFTTDDDLISQFNYTLDEVGNRTRTAGSYAWRQPTDLNYDYQYDPLYRLTRSDDSQGGFTTYQYDAVGNRLQLATNDDPTLTRDITLTIIDYSYNGANQLLSHTADVAPTGNPAPKREQQVGQALNAFVHELEAQSGKHVATTTADTLLFSAGALLADLENNPVPNEASVTAALNQLEQDVIAARDSGEIDNTGVANSLLVKLNHAHRANEKSGGELFTTLYTYDDNGNRISRLQPDTGTAQHNDQLRTDYFYDFENRLVQVQDFRDPNGRDQWQVQDETVMTFDAYGRVFRRMHDQHIGGGGQKWRDYVYDGLDPIAEYHEPSPRYDKYYRGLGRILSMDDGQGQGQGSHYYYHYDGLGSVSALTKHSGQSAHTYRYHDFGIILDNNGHAADSSNFTNPHNSYSYTGQEWDENIELFHFYAREYDPETGTWLQQDSYRGRISDPQSAHRYGYVGNNPIRYIDLWGYVRKTIGGYYVNINDQTGVVSVGGTMPTTALGIDLGQSGFSTSPTNSKYFGGNRSTPRSWYKGLGVKVNPLESVSITFYSDLASPVTLSLTRPAPSPVVCYACSGSQAASNTIDRQSASAKSCNGNVRYEFVLGVARVGQKSYDQADNPKHPGYGEKICAGAALYNATQYHLNSSDFALNQFADELIDLDYILSNGLQDSRQLMWFINANQDKYNVRAVHYLNQGYNRNWAISQLSQGAPIIVAVKGHYTLVTGFRQMSDGSYQFHMSDSYRGNWGANSPNKALNHEWVTESELSQMWGAGNAGNQPTVIYPR